MNKTAVYLSKGDKGFHAHLLAYPGCFARGATRDAAIGQLQDALRTYLEDLRRHGEDVHLTGEFQFQVVETDEQATGPFDPGDTSALFEAEKQPVTLEEIEEIYLPRAGYNRQDLLKLVAGFDDKILDWQPFPGNHTIRRVLRHIGNADEWYVSRVVSPETLPREWEQDAGMPIFEFLEMSRRTASERLRQLTEEERSRVWQPEHDTSNPGEPWSARKALRRLLEHEREHIGHIHEILALWRSHYLARLTAERGYFFWQYAFLDEKALHTPVFEDWTPKDLLAHSGEWDAVHTERMARLASGQLDLLTEIKDMSFYEERNQAYHESHQVLTSEQALAGCLAARETYLRMFEAIPDAELHRPHILPWGKEARLGRWGRWRFLHDTAHGKDLKKWRSDREIPRRVPPKALAIAAMHASRAEVTALAELLDARERTEQPVCGTWTFKDVLGHLTDWELFGLQAARLALDGVQEPDLEFPSDFEEWNVTHADARREQPWDAVWMEFLAVRRMLLEVVDQFDQSDLEGPFKTPWSKTLWGWLSIWPHHEREHAGGLRREMALTDTPARLLDHSPE
jgi:predicted RNase H-like HicB family nuclease/uncharacterized damage-inducible protein DinB